MLIQTEVERETNSWFGLRTWCKIQTFLQGTKHEESLIEWFNMYHGIHSFHFSLEQTSSRVAI